MSEKNVAPRTSGAKQALAPIDPNAPGLLSWEQARAALAKADTIDAVKALRDKADALRRYYRARKVGGEELAVEAGEFVLDAELKLGALLEVPGQKARGRAGPGRGKAGYQAGPAFPDAPTLAEQGITKRESTRWQKAAKMARAAPGALAELKRKARKSKRPIRSADLEKFCKQNEKAAAAAKLRAAPLPEPSGRFSVIVIDPPWRYSKRAADTTHRGRNPYPDMSTEQIQALPIVKHAEADCILWLWTTNAFIHEAFHCLGAWGFEPKTILTWAKDRLGTGDWLRGKTEHCILAVRGKPLVTLTNQTTLLAAPLREHSRKPDEFFALVDALCPGSKLEMFAREKREGWQAWGSEPAKFGAT